MLLATPRGLWCWWAMTVRTKDTCPDPTATAPDPTPPHKAASTIVPSRFDSRRMEPEPRFLLTDTARPIARLHGCSARLENHRKHDRRATGSAAIEARDSRTPRPRLSHSLDLAPASVAGSICRGRAGAQHTRIRVSQGFRQRRLRSDATRSPVDRPDSGAGAAAQRPALRNADRCADCGPDGEAEAKLDTRSDRPPNSFSCPIAFGDALARFRSDLRSDARSGSHAHAGFDAWPERRSDVNADRRAQRRPDREPDVRSDAPVKPGSNARADHGVDQRPRSDEYPGPRSQRDSLA